MKIVTLTKKFVADHKFAIGIVVGAAPALALVVRNAKITNEFLMENNLFDKYYTMDEI